MIKNSDKTSSSGAQKNWGKENPADPQTKNGILKEPLSAIRESYGLAEKESEKQVKDWKKTGI